MKEFQHLRPFFFYDKIIFFYIIIILTNKLKILYTKILKNLKLKLN